MNLEKLYKMQNTLDERIVSEKKLEGCRLLSEKLTALFVELGECANEWRGFKFWSEDRESRVSALRTSPVIGKGIAYNPLLEEYVDCLHFVLSIGLEIGTRLFTVKPYHAENVNEQFQKVYINLSLLTISEQTKEKRAYLQDDFEDLANSFAALGEKLGFTLDEIEKAYFEKNAVNHERQNNGY